MYIYIAAMVIYSVHSLAMHRKGAKQHTATYCRPLPNTATRCDTQQHTAKHCNKLQHTATHGNTR